MLGGYTHFEADAFYISDNPVLANSTKIWKWGIGGFGYSEDGGETYTTGITASGSIVANLISAGIVTAEMIQTGILQSEDGKTWINLNNGEFNFQDKFKFTNGSFSVQLDEETIDEIATEITPYTVVLGNENQAIPTDSLGVVKTTAFVQTRVNVYKGNILTAKTITSVTLKDSNGNVISGQTITIVQPTAEAGGLVTWVIPIETNLPTDTGVLEIDVEVETGVIQTKALSWHKAKAGPEGANARLVTISPSNTAFTSDTVGSDISDYIWTPSTIVLTPAFQNCTPHPITWQYSFNGTSWFTASSGVAGLTINETTKALTIANNSTLYNTQNHVTFRVRSTENDMDSITINRLFNSINLATRVTEAESKVELSNTAWSARFSSILNMGVKIRYIRDWQNGSVESPNFSYWNEIQVYDINGVNGASAGIVTASSAAHTSYPLSNWTDGSLSQYARVQGTGWQYLQWDLGVPTEGIEKIGIKHQGTGRRYNHKLEVSEDGINWFSLYDSEIDGYYTETSTPKIYELNVLQTGITTISATGVKVEHSGSGGQYSEMRADGFIRQWQYGESKYLNDIFMYQKFSSPVFRDTPPPTVRISLPQSFRGRGSTTKIIPVSTDFYLSGAGVSSYGEVRSIIGYHKRILDIVASDFTSDTPYVDVDSYVEFEDYNMWDDWDGEYGYHTAGFVLIVIGY